MVINFSSNFCFSGALCPPPLTIIFEAFLSFLGGRRILSAVVFNSAFLSGAARQPADSRFDIQVLHLIVLQPGEHGSVLGDVGDPAVLYVLAQVRGGWLSSLCILNFFFQVSVLGLA